MISKTFEQFEHKTTEVDSFDIFKMADMASVFNNSRRKSPDPGGCGEPNMKLTPYNPITAEYDMSGNKMLIIFNQHKFQNSKHFRRQPPERASTFEDVQRLEGSFGARNFNVTTHNDLTHHEILNQVKKIGAEDHSSTSCLAIAILTHGKENGMVCAADREYHIYDVINFILQQPALAGKPKLFLIQVCRGNNLDLGHCVRVNDEVSYLIPTHSDCLVLRSSLEGFASCHGSEGCMIQTLFNILGEDNRVNILDVVVSLNHRLRLQTLSSNNKPKLNKKRQAPETTLTLTKHLYI